MDGDKNNSAYDPVVRRRIRLLAAIFAAWLLVALGRAWYIAVPCRTFYAAIGDRMARRVFRIPAPRGRIMDAEGVPLAWNVHFFDLVSTAPARGLNAEELAALKKVLPDVDPACVPLRRNLTPEEVTGLKEVIDSGVRVQIVTRNERIVIDSPAIRKRVGKVSIEDGVVRGVSGWEKEFDRELSGIVGRMSVMLDRNRNWISVESLTPMTAGKDVRLPHALRKLETLKEGGAADGN